MLKKEALDRLKLALGVFVGVACISVLWIFLNSFHTGVETEKGKDIPPKAGFSIGEIKHLATRNGMTEWELRASSAEYTDEDKKAILHDLSLTFYLENSEKAFVYAQKGILNAGENDIRLSGNVTLDKQGYNFQTEGLAYTYEKRLIHSETPVTLKGNSVYLSADTMTIDLNTNKIYLKGHVKGAFDDPIHP
jgi:lipopolysaccharide export system protein LptC